MAIAHRHAFSQVDTWTVADRQSDVAWIMRTDASGPRVLSQAHAPLSYDIVRGVLMLQVSVGGQPTQIWSAQGRTQRLEVMSYPDGVIALTVHTGTEVLSYPLRVGLRLMSDPILQIRWDAVTGRAHLRIWNDSADMAEQGIPLPGGLEPSLLQDAMTRSPSQAVPFVALGRGAALLAGRCGVAPGALVHTPSGPQSIETLIAGDRVRSADGGWAQVLMHRVHSVPCCGQLRPLTLRAPYFDLVADLTLLPHVDVGVCGSSVEYLFGQNQVRLPVRALCGYRRAVRLISDDVAQMVELRLDRAVPILMNGASVYLPTTQAEGAGLPRRLSTQEVFTLRRFRQR